MPLRLVFGAIVTEDQAVRSVDSKVLCDADWDVEFEDLPTQNGRVQLLVATAIGCASY